MNDGSNRVTWSRNTGKKGETGLLCPDVPVDFGGGGGDFGFDAITYEEAQRGCITSLETQYKVLWLIIFKVRHRRSENTLASENGHRGDYNCHRDDRARNGSDLQSVKRELFETGMTTCSLAQRFLLPMDLTLI